MQLGLACMIVFPTILDEQNTETSSMQAVHICFEIYLKATVLPINNC
jgi:hypothetical protein